MKRSRKVSTEELLQQAMTVRDIRANVRRQNQELYEALTKLKVLLNRASAVTVKQFTVKSVEREN